MGRDEICKVRQTQVAGPTIEDAAKVVWIAVPANGRWGL